MTGENRVVKTLVFRVCCANRDAVFFASNRFDGRVQPNSAFKRSDQFFDIASGTAGDYSPLRPVSNAEQAVVSVELDDKPDGKLAERLRRTGPDRRSHRNEVQIRKLFGIPPLSDVVIDGQVFVILFEQFERLSVEAKNVLQHSMKARF